MSVLLRGISVRYSPIQLIFKKNKRLLLSKSSALAVGKTALKLFDQAEGISLAICPCFPIDQRWLVQL